MVTPSRTSRPQNKPYKWCLLLIILVFAVILWNDEQPNEWTSNNDTVDFFLETGQGGSGSMQWTATTNRSNQARIQKKSKLRILYIVTSLAEYNSGKRSTAKGSDRLQETLIPVLREGVLDMLDHNYHVDVFLICHWTVKSERFVLIRSAIPSQVGLQYWDEATPLSYKLEEKTLKYVRENTRALARQHRFVIKDKFFDYDMFVNFEDDMLIKGHHVEHNLFVSRELARLRDLAPEASTLFNVSKKSKNELQRIFHGELTKPQIRRMIPGFIRVEVLLDEEKYPAQSHTGPIPVDLNFTNGYSEVHAEYCCHVRNETSSSKIPFQPAANKLFMWETGIIALGIHKMPKHSKLDWVVFQRGPHPSQTEANETIGEYYSGRNGEFGTVNRPNPTEGRYVNNQGGWMASRELLWGWHDSVCPGGFLPPYYVPHYNMDGLDARNVEYWSGGLHLFTRQHACNMQRIITIDPEGFSKHLIYHTANNKQIQLTNKREKTFIRANTLLGQLNSVRKKAEKEIPSHEKL